MGLINRRETPLASVSESAPPAPIAPFTPQPPYYEAYVEGGVYVCIKGNEITKGRERILAVKPVPLGGDSRSGHVECDHCPARTTRVFPEEVVCALFQTPPFYSMIIPSTTPMDCCGLTSTAQDDVTTLLVSVREYLTAQKDSPPWCPLQVVVPQRQPLPQERPIPVGYEPQVTLFDQLKKKTVVTARKVLGSIVSLR